MVALDSSGEKNHSGAENMLGIKKSKKKKSKKIDTESVQVNQIDDTAKIDAMKEMVNQVDINLKKKKKKDKRKEDGEKGEVENQNKDEKVEKTRKRKVDETLEDQNPESEEQNEAQQSKKKKQKKNKKPKEQRQSDETSESLNIVSNDDNEALKKKKKMDKKAKKEEKLDEESDGIVGNTTDETASIFKKDFYSAAYASFPHDEKEKEKLDAEQYRKEHRITMYGKGKSKGQFHPIRDFNKLGFEENLLGAVKNFKEPTPIQASAWPLIASGRDTIGIAQTGSGKTLAFSIPALAHLKHRLDQEKTNKAGGQNKRRGPMMLILAPTRELAQQSQDVLEVAGKYCGVRSVAVYGGVSKDGQRRSLLNTKGNAPFEVVVATPGKMG